MTLVSSRKGFKTLSDAQQQEERVKWKDTKCDQWSSCFFDYYLFILLLPIQQVIGTVVRWYCRYLTHHSPDTIDHLRVRARVKKWRKGRRGIDRSAHLNRLIPRAGSHTQSTHSGNHWPHFCWFVVFFFFPFLPSFFPLFLPCFFSLLPRKVHL